MLVQTEGGPCVLIRKTKMPWGIAAGSDDASPQMGLVSFWQPQPLQLCPQSGARRFHAHLDINLSTQGHRAGSLA